MLGLQMAKSTKKRRWVEHRVASVSNYVELIEKVKKAEQDKGNSADFMFRGQPVDKPLLPKLARPPLHHDLLNRERLMLEEFKRMSVVLTEIKPDPDWELSRLLSTTACRRGYWIGLTEH